MNHKGSINLETQRLILKKLKVEDAEEVFKKMGDAPYSHGLMVAAFQLFQRYKKYGR